MIKTQELKKSGETRVTFVLPSNDSRLPASVVGEFNGWDPMAHPLRKRSNGTHSVAVTLPRGGCYEFRYLGSNGHWFDEDPDGVVVTRGRSDANCLVNA